MKILQIAVILASTMLLGCPTFTMAQPGLTTSAAVKQSAELVAELAESRLVLEAPFVAQDALSMTYIGPGPRFNEYAGFQVVLRNNTSADVTNPQTQIVVLLGGYEWTCQGYYDPLTGVPVSGVLDVLGMPLVIPAGQELPVTILCRIPEAPLDTAQLHIR